MMPEDVEGASNDVTERPETSQEPSLATVRWVGVPPEDFR